MSSTLGPKVNVDGPARNRRGSQKGLIYYIDAGNKLSARDGSTKLIDLIGGKEATITGGSWNNRNGGAIQLDGVNDYIQVRNLHDFGEVDDLTIEIVAEAFNDHDGVLIDSTDGRGAGFVTRLGDVKDFQIGNQRANPTEYLIHSHGSGLGSLLEAGVFTLTFSVDNSGNAELFYNGNKVYGNSGLSRGWRTLSANSSYPMYLFSSQGGGSNFFKGYFYSLKIYSKKAVPSGKSSNIRSKQRRYNLTRRKL